jgi:hypothetical protein
LTQDSTLNGGVAIGGEAKCILFFRLPPNEEKRDGD